MNKLTIMFSLWLFAGLGMLAQTENTHTVKRGENFAVIAKRYGITEEQLKAANPDKTVCYVGLKLELPENAASQETSLPPAEENISTPPLSQSLADTDKQTNIAEKSLPKKKKKGFWKGVGNFLSGMGDVVVAVASGMSETGLLDETGAVGALVGGTADIVNLTRGTQSNFLGEATKGEYDSDSGNGNNEKEMATQNGNIESMKQKLSQKKQERKQVQNQFDLWTKQYKAKNSNWWKSPEKLNRSNPYYNKLKALNAEILNMEIQIHKAEGTYEEWHAAKREKVARTIERHRAHSESLEKTRNSAVYNAETRTKDYIQDQNIDIETNTEKWIDAYGIEGTKKIYNENKNKIEEYNKKYYSK